jgi:hypothetical protein
MFRRPSGSIIIYRRLLIFFWYICRYDRLIASYLCTYHRVLQLASCTRRRRLCPMRRICEVLWRSCGTTAPRAWKKLVSMISIRLRVSDKRARRTASTTSVHHASTFNIFLVYYIRKEMLDHLCWNLNYLNKRRKSYIGLNVRWAPSIHNIATASNRPDLDSGENSWKGNYVFKWLEDMLGILANHDSQRTTSESFQVQIIKGTAGGNKLELISKNN